MLSSLCYIPIIHFTSLESQTLTKSYIHSLADLQAPRIRESKPQHHHLHRLPTPTRSTRRRHPRGYRRSLEVDQDRATEHLIFTRRASRSEQDHDGWRVSRRYVSLWPIIRLECNRFTSTVTNILTTLTGYMAVQAALLHPEMHVKATISQWGVLDIKTPHYTTSYEKLILGNPMVRTSSAHPALTIHRSTTLSP